MISNNITTIMMTREEAESHVTAINHAAADMGRRLLELKEREGWRALGYKSWTQFLTNEFDYSRKHLYELMKAAPILENLLPLGNNISTKAAAALADYPQHLHPAILDTTNARYGEITESNVNRVGRLITEMATTGRVDTGNGTSTPIDAALTKEDEEAVKRQKAYIAENVERKNGNGKNSLVLTLPTPPSANTMWKSSGAVRLSQEAANYKLEIGWKAREAGCEPLSGDVVVTLRIFRPARRQDIDNFLPLILDGLQGHAYHNDSQIKALHVYMSEDRENARVEVELRPA